MHSHHAHLASVALPIILFLGAIPGEPHLTAVDVSGSLCLAVIWHRVVPVRLLLASSLCLIPMHSTGLPLLHSLQATVNRSLSLLIRPAKSGSPCRSPIPSVCMILSVRRLHNGLSQRPVLDPGVSLLTRRERSGLLSIMAIKSALLIRTRRRFMKLRPPQRIVNPMVLRWTLQIISGLLRMTILLH